MSGREKSIFSNLLILVQKSPKTVQMDSRLDYIFEPN